MNTVYEIRGMTCAGCKRSLLRALRAAHFAVEDDDVSVERGTLSLPAADRSRLAAVVQSAGFELGEPLAQS